MAGTSVLKLKVDGNEYDAGLKKAQQGLQALEKSLQEAGKSFTDVDRQVVEYVRAIGQMDTTAKSSRGALRDMTQTLTDLTIQYRALTDEEKKSPFGVALSHSIGDLTERASAINDAMSDVSQSITNAASDTRKFDQMAQGVGVLTAGFQGLTGAGKLLGINMGDNVELIAKLQAAMAVTNSLTTIQNALQKQSAFMQGVLAAKTAILSTAQNILAGKLTAATVAQNALNLAMKAAPWGIAIGLLGGVASALGLFSSGTDDATTKSSKFTSQLDAMNDRLDALQKSLQSTLNYMNKIGAASSEIDDAEYKAADEALSAALSDYNSLFNKKFSRNSVLGNIERDINQSLITDEERKRAEDNLQAARDRLAAAEARRQTNAKVGSFFESNWQGLNTDKEINAAIGYFRKLREEYQRGSAEYQEMTRRIDILNKKINSTGPNAKHTSGGGKNESEVIAPQYSIAGLTEDLKYLQQEQQKATNPEEWRTYADAIRAVNDEIKKVKGELSSLGTANASGISISAILSDRAEASQESFRKQKLEPKPVEKTEVKLNEQVGQIVGGINGIASGIESLGIELPKGFKDVIGGMQSVISIMSGISSILVAIEAINTADAIIPFHTGGTVRAAQGYRVPGNYGYDAVPAILTSGETVLTRAQAGNLASQLAERDSGMVMQPYVDGEKICLGMNNTSKRMGRGEIVTTSMLRQYGLLN